MIAVQRKLPGELVAVQRKLPGEFIAVQRKLPGEFPNKSNKKTGWLVTIPLQTDQALIGIIISNEGTQQLPFYRNLL